MGFWEKRKDDWSRKRVSSINRYAVLMGYLSMAIQGLGFLVLTWTTVVLLGGFVSTLHKNDFWSLTFITLVQTAGIFDVVLNEKLSYVMRAIGGLLSRVFQGVRGSPDSILVAIARFLLAGILMFVQLLVLAAVLCPLAIIYVFGILISGGISLWRLKEHEYRGSDGEESNLPAAMDTLYYLALIQCVLFCYRYVLARTGKRLADGKASTCNDLEKAVLSRYLRETKKGCEKDPSFADGRDLITHAIDMIGSKSPLDSIDGVQVLYTSICILESRMPIAREESFFMEERMEMDQLVIVATSSRKVLQKLLEMLSPIGLHDRETRNQAAKIVECLASNINLEQFPRGIDYISSLIGTLQQYGDGNTGGELVQAYKDLLLRGLCIIRELASREKNCRIISDTQNLVYQISAPVTSDLLHNTSDDHGEWSNIVEISVEVMCRLSDAPGETGTKLCHEISSCKEAIRTLERIIGCNVCKTELQEKAIQILAQLHMDAESSRLADHVLLKKDFVEMLLYIFTDENKSIQVRRCTGAALSSFQGGSNATIVMQASANVVNCLTLVLQDDQDMVLRRHAAIILEHLWTYYTEHDNYLSVFRTEMSIAVGKIIKEITDTGTDILDSPQADIENQIDNILPKATTSYSFSSLPPLCSFSSWQRKNDELDNKEVVQLRMLSSLLSLCGMVYDKLISERSDLTPQFDNPSKFLYMLKEMVVEKDEYPTVDNLSLSKSIAKMVISIMKHSNGRFVVEREDLHTLIEELSSASKNMLDLDYSMIFSSTSRFEPTMKVDKYTLASLVKEARELYATLPSTSGSG